MMKGLDIKFPMLLGDQYHTTAFYLTARLGSQELCKILATIEENFSKVFFDPNMLSSSFDQNIKLIYKHFYNYLPTFFANGLKGVALIFNLGTKDIEKAF